MNRLIVVLALVMALSATGCRPVQSQAGQPTPFQRAVTYNTALADTNNSLAQAVIILNSSGKVTDAQAVAILSVQKKIAFVDIQITNILAQGSTATQASSAEILSLVNQITDAAKTLEAQHVIPTTPDAIQIQTEIDTLISTSQSVITNLHIAGVK